MAKITSSSNRSKRTSKQPVTKGQNPQRANRQAVSQAKVSSSSQRTSTGSAKVTQGRGGSSMKADAQRWQKLNQSASARAGKAAEAGPRKPAPGTGNVVRTAIEYGQKAKEVQRQATRAAKQAKGNYGKLAGTLAKGVGKAVVGSIRKNPVVATAVAASAPRALGDASMAGRNYGKFQNARAAAFKKAAAIKGSPVVGPKKSSASQFDSAFAAARKAGKNTFTWKGKKYNTKLRGEK